MIIINNLTKMYGNKVVLKNVNVSFPEKKLVFLLGPNGAGKTTLIKCLTDIESYEGEILYDGKKYENVRNDFYVLWDDCPFYGGMSGLDNLIIFSEEKYKKEEIISKVESFIDKSLLKQRVKTYSYGQKKKLALALVTLLNPEIIIMDEITNGLDYETLKMLQEIIREWSKTKTVIMTGHQFGFYNGLVEDIYIYKNNTIEHVENIDVKSTKLEEVYDENLL